MHCRGDARVPLAAYGYPIQQFVSSSANARIDHYDGTAASRVRFALDVIDAVDAASARTVWRCGSHPAAWPSGSPRPTSLSVTPLWSRADRASDPGVPAMPWGTSSLVVRALVTRLKPNIGHAYCLSGGKGPGSAPVTGGRDSEPNRTDLPHRDLARDGVWT
jgi:NADH:flavin oxidoreductase/NADH oxidase family protein